MFTKPYQFAKPDEQRKFIYFDLASNRLCRLPEQDMAEKRFQPNRPVIMKKETQKDETSEFRERMLSRQERKKRRELILKVLLIALIIVIGILTAII